MSESVDRERAEMSAELRLERSKRIRNQMNDVVRLWAEGLSVALIASRLGVERHRIYFVLRVLELKDTRVKHPPRPGHLYGLAVPPIDGDSDAA